MLDKIKNHLNPAKIIEWVTLIGILGGLLAYGDSLFVSEAELETAVQNLIEVGEILASIELDQTLLAKEGLSDAERAAIQDRIDAGEARISEIRNSAQ